MARNELLERILHAWFELDTTDKHGKAEALRRLDVLVNQAIEGKSTSRGELLEALKDRYRCFCREQRSKDKLRVSQSSRKR